jgi:hypothetical protein
MAKFKVKQTKEIVRPFTYHIQANNFDQKITVHIKYISEKEITKFNKQARQPLWVKHQRQSEVDIDAYNKLFLSAAIADIQGMTLQGLRYIIEPHVVLQLEENTKWTDNVKYDEEVRDLIVEYITFDFFTFVTTNARETREAVQNEEKQEIQNLEHTSGTKKAPKD